MNICVNSTIRSYVLFAIWVYGSLSNCQIVGSPSLIAPMANAEIPEHSQIWMGNLGFEPVGPGDLIYVSVSGAPELTQSYRVSAEGQLVMPMVQEPIPISGLTPTVVSQAITAELQKEKILVDPTVSVAVLEYRSRLVNVVGAVKVPSTMQALGDFKLLDAIARAQGISPEAGPEIVITRATAQAGGRETLRIPAKPLLEGKDQSLNISLHGGEVITVPEAPKVYVLGNVKLPGPYPINDLEGASVLKALAYSQGPLQYTARDAYVYRVVSGSVKREEIRIELRKILHRKAPDVQLQANDILYVPDNSALRANMSVLEHMAGFGSSVASGLIIWH